MAAKTLWQPAFVERARNLCLLGATDQQIAACLGVGYSTFKKWKTVYPELAETMQSGKDAADAKVAKSLYQRAIGFTQQEVDIRVIGGKVVQTVYTKRYAPDPTSCIFWLKNRQPELWNDRRNADTNPVQQQLMVFEAQLRAVELERAKFLLAELKAEKTDVDTNTDKSDFLAELATRLPN